MAALRKQLSLVLRCGAFNLEVQFECSRVTMSQIPIHNGCLSASLRTLDYSGLPVLRDSSRRPQHRRGSLPASRDSTPHPLLYVAGTVLQDPQKQEKRVRVHAWQRPHGYGVLLPTHLVVLLLCKFLFLCHRARAQPRDKLFHHSCCYAATQLAFRAMLQLYTIGSPREGGVDTCIICRKLESSRKEFQCPNFITVEGMKERMQTI